MNENDATLLFEDAPHFSLDSTQGAVVLTDLLARGKLILVFFEDGESPHTRSLLGLMQDYERLIAESTASVVGVSPAPLAALQSLAGVTGLSYPLATDVDGSVARSYGVKPDARGDTRAVFVIDTDGVVILEMLSYHPANITQLEAIFLALGAVEEGPPTMMEQRPTSIWQRLINWI